MRRLPVTALVLGAVLLTGCSTVEKGNPTASPGAGEDSTAAPTSAPTSSPGGGGGGSDVPKVANPFDPGEFVSTPCNAMTPAQADELGVQPGKPDTGSLGPVCLWSSGAGGLVNLGFDTRGKGLGGVYEAHDDGKYEYFEEQSEVAGFPAVTALIRDRREQGECAYDIGLRDDLLMSVDTTLSLDKRGSTDPCTVTRRVAEDLLKTMKAGG